MRITRRELLFLIPGILQAQERSRLFEYRDRRGRIRPVRSPADWTIRTEQIRAAMQEVMGPLPGKLRPPPPVTVLGEVRMDGYLRRKIEFAPDENDRVPAYLLLPNARSSGRPAMLCLHQTVRIGKDEPVGLGGKPNLRYAHELATRGYIILAPDYPGFGDYKADVYARGYISATMNGIWNHIRAMDLLASMPEVDERRIGVIGHSLGGHNSLFAAAFEPRLGAVVTSCGFTSFPKYYGGDLTGWSHAGYMPRIASVYGKSPDRMPFDFPEVLGALAPRHVFINAPLGDSNFEVSGVRDCVDAAQAVYRKVFRAGDRLRAVYPDCGHDFPCEIREQAYRFLDSWSGLKAQNPAVCA